MKTQIKCPKCGNSFFAEESLIAHIKEEATLLIEKKLRQKIEEEKKLEVENLTKEIQENRQKIDDFRNKELELRKIARNLEEKQKDLELETQRRIDEEKRKIEEETAKKLIDEHHLKDLEKDKKMADMEKLIIDLKRTSQQNSMQTQGEAGELDLEKILRNLFPTDEILEVKKGELGGDIRQVVKTVRGTDCGMILWERKNTKTWQEVWIKKLKEDVRRDKALLGVIVTEALPKDFTKEIGEKNGIWIVSRGFIEPLAILLRKNLYDVAKNKAITFNKQSKAEGLYDFVTSNDFIQQVEKMVDIYMEMKMQVSRERASSERLWKQREMQIDGLLKGISGIYGGMQLMAGSALPQVKSLEIGDS